MDGIGISAVAIGGVFIWGGIKGYSPLRALANVVSGKNPNEDQSTSTLSTDNTAAPAIAAGIASGSAPGNQAIAKVLAAPYGWSTGAEWDALVKLWTKESGWSATAQNPTSTAYGIAQFLDSTWAPYGPKTSSATLQIKYGLEYIKDRYGDPIAAWAHETANNWY